MFLYASNLGWKLFWYARWCERVLDSNGYSIWSKFTLNLSCKTLWIWHKSFTSLLSWSLAIITFHKSCTTTIYFLHSFDVPWGTWVPEWTSVFDLRSYIYVLNASCLTLGRAFMKITPCEVECEACFSTDGVYMGVAVEFIIKGHTEILVVLCFFDWLIENRSLFLVQLCTV